MTAYDRIYLTMNDKPAAILRGLDGILVRRESVKQTNARRRFLPLLLFLAGFPGIMVDLFFFLLGYKLFLFTFLTLLLWIAALAVLIVNRRNKVPNLPPVFYEAKEILYTLRDDIDPKRTFFGHLDLTGTRQPEKVARESSNALGLITQYFRDDWFSLKTRLYDGNMLRLSVLRREKVRKGYYKRGKISGKRKWKPPKDKGRLHELKIRITFNLDVYEEYIIHSLREGMKVGDYTIESVMNEPGSLILVASTQAANVTASNILSVLKNSYDMLKRKG
jgi:hypothetical protein